MSTMTKPPKESRPVALIVEDVPNMLDSRKAIFNLNGFFAIGARSKAEALRELRSAPAIDIVVTDIGLNPENPEKDSGFDLLEEVRRRRKDLPVVGYSAQMDEEALNNTEFDDILPKGQAYRLEEKIEKWLELALAYREARIATAKEKLRKLQVRYRITDTDIEILRDFLPGSHMVPPDESVEEMETADALLRRAGYRLRIIEAQTPVSDAGIKVAGPVAVWLREVPDAIIAELYGHPSIYGEGEIGDQLALSREQSLRRAEDQAVGQVLDLMYGYHLDFKEKEGETNARAEQEQPEEMTALRDFLRKVFG
jgi:CheY-like chemotaxis protein